MKKLYLLIVIVLTALVAYAQPLMDTAVKLIAQKENIIKENTIVTVENLGDQINTGYPEMRPTVSADGNMLFLSARATRPMFKLPPYPLPRIFGIAYGIAWENGAGQSTLTATSMFLILMQCFGFRRI